MPWTQKQHNLFQAAAHNPDFANKVGIPQDKAAQMAKEGVKKSTKLANALKQYKSKI